MANYYAGTGNDFAYIVEGSSTVLTWFSFGYAVGGATGKETGAIRVVSVTIPQGTVVDSATLHFRCETAVPASNQNVKMKISGIDEDNTATFTSDPWGRAKTTNNYTNEYSNSSNDTWIDITVTDIVNEILGRGGWSSGNAMGFIIEDNGTATDQTRDLNDDYGGTYDSYLSVVLHTPSASPSRSISRSPSASPSPTPSPSPSPIPSFFGLKIAKPGIDVLTTDNPVDFIFNSDYGTLKYLSKQEINTSFDANAGPVACTGTYAHGLGYYPFVEVFVSVYIGTPTGIYEYCPFFGSGATVEYSANYKITSTEIVVYGEIEGASTSVWHFDFLVFIYKNNLQL